MHCVATRKDLFDERGFSQVAKLNFDACAPELAQSGQLDIVCIAPGESCVDAERDADRAQRASR